MTLPEGAKDDIETLKKELADLRRRLDDLSKETVEGAKKPKAGIRIDIGDFVNEIMEGVMTGISGEIEKAVLIGPRGVYIGRTKGREEPEEVEEKMDPAKTASVMGALSSEHRLKILSELMTGGKYANELEQKIPDISASTLSSHLKALEEAGFTVQEAVRGRYLITIPGRVALKTAHQLVRLLEEG